MSSDDVCHFWRLPFELRDNIYDLLAADEGRLALRIDLCANEMREPHVKAYTASGISRASSELNQEYSVALGRRVKSIIRAQAPADDSVDPGHNFAYVTPYSAHDEPNKKTTIKGDWLAKDEQRMQQLTAKSRIHVSQDWRPRKGTLFQRAHAYTVPVAYRVKETISLNNRRWMGGLLPTMTIWPAWAQVQRPLSTMSKEIEVLQELFVTFVADKGEELATKVVFPAVADSQASHKTRQEMELATADMVISFSKTNWGTFEEYRRLGEVYVACFGSSRTGR